MTDRLSEIEARALWCEAWLTRQNVAHPAITVEWRNLLADVPWLVARVRELETWKADVETHGLCTHNVPINRPCELCNEDFARDYPEVAARVALAPAEQEGQR